MALSALKFRVRGSAKAAPVVIDRNEVKRLEAEHVSFTRALRQLGSLDAQPAVAAYLAKSRSASEAVGRTTAPPSKDMSPAAAAVDRGWSMHAGLHARSVVHVASMHGRDEALEEILNASEVADKKAAAAAAKGRRAVAAAALAPEVPGPWLTQCLNSVDGHGDTALVLAARGGHIECCRLLLTAGCDPNVAGPSGHTAMHVAALRDERECLEAIFAYEGNPLLTTFNGHTVSSRHHATPSFDQNLS